VVLRRALRLSRWQGMLPMQAISPMRCCSGVSIPQPSHCGLPGSVVSKRLLIKLAAQRFLLTINSWLLHRQAELSWRPLCKQLCSVQPADTKCKRQQAPVD
jgi:hypothetical protein